MARHALSATVVFDERSARLIQDTAHLLGAQEWNDVLDLLQTRVIDPERCLTATVKKGVAYVALEPFAELIFLEAREQARHAANEDEAYDRVEELLELAGYPE